MAKNDDKEFKHDDCIMCKYRLACYFVQGYAEGMNDDTLLGYMDRKVFMDGGHSKDSNSTMSKYL